MGRTGQEDVEIAAHGPVPDDILQAIILRVPRPYRLPAETHIDCPGHTQAAGGLKANLPLQRYVGPNGWQVTTGCWAKDRSRPYALNHIPRQKVYDGLFLTAGLLATCMPNLHSNRRMTLPVLCVYKARCPCFMAEIHAAHATWASAG